jgi:hypothetical protein
MTFIIMAPKYYLTLSMTAHSITALTIMTIDTMTHSISTLRIINLSTMTKIIP